MPSPAPHLDDKDGSESFDRLSLGLEKDTSVPSTEPDETETISYGITQSETRYSIPVGTIVEVIHSFGSSPNIVIEDYAPSTASSSSSIVSSCSGVSLDGNRVRRDLLRVPPMTWTAPREHVSPCSPKSTTSPKKGKKGLKKKGSMAKLVAMLSEISNVARLHPELSSSTSEDNAASMKTKMLRKNLKTSSHRRRSKENEA